MSGSTGHRALAGVAAGALVVGGLVLPQQTARADYEYTAIPQAQMSVVEVDSVESVGEGANGPGALVLDGDSSTYWHTKWQGGIDPLPHHITIKLADAPVQLGRVKLTPRQSSNGSGRVNEYELLTATGDCSSASYTKVAEGSFPGDLATALQDRVITLDAPVAASCVQVRYLSSWGGKSGSDPISPAEKVATLAEFNADIASGTPPQPTPTPTPEPGSPLVPDVVDGAITLQDGDFSVTLHPAFPQVIRYDLGDKTLVGRKGAALKAMTINGTSQAVEVGKPVVDGASATYPITVPGLPGVSFDAVATVKGSVLRLELANLKDSDRVVQRIQIPNHDLVSVGSVDTGAQLTAGLMTVNRAAKGDAFENVAKTAAGSVKGSWMAFANTSELAAAFDTNAIEDNTRSGASTANDNTRFLRQIRADGSDKIGSVWAGSRVWQSSAVATRKASETASSIGYDANPYIEVKVTGDRNGDKVVDWQDGAIASREIIEFGTAPTRSPTRSSPASPSTSFLRRRIPSCGPSTTRRGCPSPPTTLVRRRCSRAIRPRGTIRPIRITRGTTTRGQAGSRTSGRSPTSPSSSTPATACM